MTSIKIQGSYNYPFYLAVSGGPDSMACLDFFRQGKKDVTALFIDHNTEARNEGRIILEEYCAKHSLSVFSYVDLRKVLIYFQMAFKRLNLLIHSAKIYNYQQVIQACNHLI